ncbi:MAG: anaerobic ribonucleoside-triphosphate reductase [Alistipes indistinctus]
MANYCASITMYPWLVGGTISIGGNSTKPTNLKSFCGGFVNMVFIVSSMLSGACATPEFLMYLNYFIGQEYGHGLLPAVRIASSTCRSSSRTLDKVITDCFEQVVYSINQPTGARNFQAVFWNIAYYDRYYFEEPVRQLCSSPTGSRPDWDSLDWLQRRFMRWFNDERDQDGAHLSRRDDGPAVRKTATYRTKNTASMTAEMYAAGHSFFTYMSDNADSLSSCCRLRKRDSGQRFQLHARRRRRIDRVEKRADGQPRTAASNTPCATAGLPHPTFLGRRRRLACTSSSSPITRTCSDLQSKGMLPLFDAGYITMGRQYLTIGVNGLVEAAEVRSASRSATTRATRPSCRSVLGIDRDGTTNSTGRSTCCSTAKMIPAENVGVKRAEMGPRGRLRRTRATATTATFTAVEDASLNVIDKFRLHGRQIHRAPDRRFSVAHEPRRAPERRSSTASCCA